MITPRDLAEDDKHFIVYQKYGAIALKMITIRGVSRWFATDVDGDGGFRCGWSVADVHAPNSTARDCSICRTWHGLETIHPCE